jgi:hypothetical protein
MWDFFPSCATYEIIGFEKFVLVAFSSKKIRFGNEV